MNTLQIIKSQISKLIFEMDIPLEKIILFGSRARGDFTKHSDWDILIVVSKDLTIKEKMELMDKIIKRLSDCYIPCDVIIKSVREMEYYKDFIGSVVREAMKEGVVI